MPLQTSPMLFYLNFHSSFLHFALSSLIFVLSIPQHGLYLLLVASFEGLLINKEGFDVLCYPWFVVWVTVDIFNWNNGVGAEPEVVCDALWTYQCALHTLTESFLVCHLHTSSLDHLLTVLVVTGSLSQEANKRKEGSPGSDLPLPEGSHLLSDGTAHIICKGGKCVACRSRSCTKDHSVYYSGL